MVIKSYSSWPTFSEEEIEAVNAVLRSGRVNYWTGDECRRFESEFAASVGVDYAVALANGTVALDLALKVLGIGAGDEVIVTPRTFLASASSIVNSGARPVFVDVDPNSQNITAATIAPAISGRTKAILSVHLAGWPCEMDEIMDVARANGLFVIEDCAQAVGARFRGRPVGSFGDVAAWSFCQDKIITTGGEGGMLTTNDPALWRSAWAFKDHGKSWDAVYKREHPIGFRWLHESFGTNWRMTEMQAAIGRVQMKRLPEWLALRRRNAEAILDAAAACPIFRVPRPPSHVEHAWYRAYAFVCDSKSKPDWNRDRIVAEICARGIPCSMGSCSEVYLEKAFDNTGFRPLQRLPVAKELGESSVMFLVHPTITDVELDATLVAIAEVGQAALASSRTEEFVSDR